MARIATVSPSVGNEFPMKAAIDQVLTHRAGLAVIAASAVLLFWRLGQNELASWDEAIYAQVSKEILSSGDWVTLHWGHRTWFEKPPLFMWATAILYKWFGVNELWSRVGSALSGVGVAALTYLIGKKIYDRPVGLGAVLILLTTPHFVSSARIATTDIALTCFVYLAVYGYVRTWEGDTRWWYLAWTGIALAVILASVVGAVTAMLLQRYVIIVTTALAGAWTIMVGGLTIAASRGVEGLPTPGDTWILYPFTPATEQRWVPVAWLSLGLIGAIAQLWFGGRKRK